MITIGSIALKYHGVPFREPKDVDVFAKDDGIYLSSNEKLDIQYVPDSIYNIVPNTNGYASPDAIYTIKLSHLPWNVHEVEGVWEKHYRDVQYLKRIGCRIIEPLYEALSCHWTQKNGDKPFLSLEQSKEDFFTDFVEYKYPHDHLHILLSYPRMPIYLSCVKNGQEIDIDKTLFDKLSFEDKIEFFRQEIGVIAVERWLVHAPMPLVVAWCNAVKKTITTLTKGWMSEFIVRHIEYFIKPNRNDFKHIFNTLNLKENNMKQLTTEEVAGIKEEMSAFLGYYLPWRATEEVQHKWDDYAVLLGEDIFQDEAPYEFIEQEGGGEGGAEYCYSIFKWKDIFYKVVFSYASYQGYDFDYAEWYVVTPKEKMVTVYD